MAVQLPDEPPMGDPVELGFVEGVRAASRPRRRASDRIPRRCGPTCRHRAGHSGSGVWPAATPSQKLPHRDFQSEFEVTHPPRGGDRRRAGSPPSSLCARRGARGQADLRPVGHPPERTAARPTHGPDTADRATPSDVPATVDRMTVSGSRLARFGTVAAVVLMLSAVPSCRHAQPPVPLTPRPRSRRRPPPPRVPRPDRPVVSRGDFTSVSNS